jgi:hypothetical protein
MASLVPWGVALLAAAWSVGATRLATGSAAEQRQLEGRTPCICHAARLFAPKWTSFIHYACITSLCFRFPVSVASLEDTVVDLDQHIAQASTRKRVAFSLIFSCIDRFVTFYF